MDNGTDSFGGDAGKAADPAEIYSGPEFLRKNHMTEARVMDAATELALIGREYARRRAADDPDGYVEYCRDRYAQMDPDRALSLSRTLHTLCGEGTELALAIFAMHGEAALRWLREGKGEVGVTPQSLVLGEVAFGVLAE